MKSFVVFLVLYFLTAVANASETKLDGRAINTYLSETTLTSVGEDRPTEQIFRASGLTFTVDVATKAQSLGSWRVEGDKYCSVWPPSNYWVCYDMFSTADGVVFVSQDGTRYEMKKP